MRGRTTLDSNALVAISQMLVPCTKLITLIENVSFVCLLWSLSNSISYQKKMSSLSFSTLANFHFWGMREEIYCQSFGTMSYMYIHIVLTSPNSHVWKDTDVNPSRVSKLTLYVQKGHTPLQVLTQQKDFSLYVLLSYSNSSLV